MAKKRPCPWCGGSHRLKRQAKKCYENHNRKKMTWTAKELGY